MNDTTKPPDNGDKPNANPGTTVNRPDTSPPDTLGRPNPGAQPDRIVKPGDTQSGKEDSALESLGKAMSAPVLDAADENPDAPTER